MNNHPSELGRLHQALPYIFFLCFGAAYLMPWIDGDGGTAAFTLHGYDLAEWTSLNPIVQQETPALLTTWLLRSAPVYATFLFMLGTGLKPLAWLTVLLLAVGMLPPFEFVNDLTNANYRQQLFIAGLVVVAAAGGVLLHNRPASSLVGFIAALLGSFASFYGVINATTLYAHWGLSGQVGIGVPLAATALLGAAWISRPNRIRAAEFSSLPSTTCT
ncbi:MAG: hypothetical protein SNJ59_13795 [Aggregatilineales bacterium]